MEEFTLTWCQRQGPHEVRVFKSSIELAVIGQTRGARSKGLLEWRQYLMESSMSWTWETRRMSGKRVAHDITLVKVPHWSWHRYHWGRIDG